MIEYILIGFSILILIVGSLILVNYSSLEDIHDERDV